MSDPRDFWCTRDDCDHDGTTPCRNDHPAPDLLDQARVMVNYVDASEWGTPKRGRKSEKRQRSAVVSVRMTQDELARVQAEAQAVGQTVGTYMRDVALRANRRAADA